MKTLYASAAAAAALLALAACNKPAANPASSDAAASDMAAASDAGTTNPAVNGAQDAAAGPVGMASASTLGSVNADAFVSNAAQSDMYEIQAGQIASKKATSPELKKFAAMMIKDHTATTAKLKATLPSSGVKATPPASLDERRQGMIDNLNAASAADFDKVYAAQQVAAHNEALTLMKGFADHGDNDALKAVAAATAPKVQTHLDMIQKIQSGLKG